MSGRTSACSHANIVPVRPHPVMTSSAMNSTPCVGKSPQGFEYGGWVHEHAAGAEHEWLDDKRGYVTAATERFEGVERCILAAQGRKWNSLDIVEELLVDLCKQPSCTDRHRADRVAVVAVFHHDNPVARLPAVTPEPQCHLERHFYSGGT